MRCLNPSLRSYPPLDIETTLYERETPTGKSYGFGCLPRLIDKHRFIFIVDSNHRAVYWGVPPPEKCYIQRRSVPSTPPPGRRNTEEITRPNEIKGMASSSKLRIHHHHKLHQNSFHALLQVPLFCKGRQTITGVLKQWGSIRIPPLFAALSRKLTRSHPTTSPPSQNQIS